MILSLLDGLDGGKSNLIISSMAQWSRSLVTNMKQKITHNLYENLVTPLLKKLSRPELPIEFAERMKPRKNIRKNRVSIRIPNLPTHYSSIFTHPFLIFRKTEK